MPSICWDTAGPDRAKEIRTPNVKNQVEIILMQRRDLLKISPLALASAAAGRVAYAQTPVPGGLEALFNVRTYGATGDGRTVDSPAINKAIEAVGAVGGGTLIFPAGTYLCFTIRLKSKV